MKQCCFFLFVFFPSFSLQQRPTTQKRIKERRERPGTHYALAPHLDYDDSVYNPPAGFEPYWPVGEWVYEEAYTTFYTTTSTVPPLVFGRPCPKHYRHIKEVCSHMMSRYWKTYGCDTYNNYYYPCDGSTMDHHYGYKTFPSFCRFLEFNYYYSIKFKFIFIHVGPCINEKPIYQPYNPLFLPGFISERYHYFMDKLNTTFFNVTTEEDLTIAPPVDMGTLLDE